MVTKKDLESLVKSINTYSIMHYVLVNKNLIPVQLNMNESQTCSIVI